MPKYIYSEGTVTKLISAILTAVGVPGAPTGVIAKLIKLDPKFKKLFNDLEKDVDDIEKWAIYRRKTDPVFKQAEQDAIKLLRGE